MLPGGYKVETQLTILKSEDEINIKLPLLWPNGHMYVFIYAFIAVFQNIL